MGSKNINMGQRRELTICPEEVVEQLEKGEAVPALGWLDLQGGVHVDGVKGQEVLCMLHHEVCPPCKRLETQQEGQQTGEQGLPLKDEREWCTLLERIALRRKHHRVDVRLVRRGTVWRTYSFLLGLDLSRSNMKLEPLETKGNS